MITPDYLNNIIKGVENRLSENNEYLIRHIAKHIGDSFDKKENNILMPSTIRDLYKLMDSGMVLDDIQKEVEKLLPDIRKEIKQAFLDSADEISKYETDFSRKIIKTLDNHGQPVDIDIPDFEKEGIPKSAKDLNMTAMEIRQLERIYRKTQEEVSNLCHTIPSAGQTAYINACERAYMKAQSGISPNTAIIESIEEMAQEGIKVVNYDSGHVDRIEVAVARAVRSGINKANSEIVLTRCAEMGVGYVKVSSHLGARVTGTQDYRDHAHWQGKVYKLDFNNPELKKYVPTPQDEEQNRQDGFGWFDDVKKAIGNDDIDNRPIQNPLTIDEFQDIKDKKEILPEVVDEIYKFLEKHNMLNLYKNVRIIDKESQDVFITDISQFGNWNNCDLLINKYFFKNYNVEQLNDIINNAGNTVCNSLEEAIIHEAYHARMAQMTSHSVLKRHNDVKDIDEFKSISETAMKDELEAIAEIGVLYERGEYDKVLKKGKDLFEQYFSVRK